MVESTKQSDSIGSDLIVRYLGRRNYEPVWLAMKDFTANRDDQTQG